MRLSTVFVVGMAVARVATAAPADWAVQRNPFDPTDITRYKAVLAKDPHDRILDRLVALYRSYRSVDLLLQEYEAEAGYTAFVVIGRLHRGAGHPVLALEAWSHATAIRDDDARTWQLVADAARATGQYLVARVAYERAVRYAPPAIAKPLLKAAAEFALASTERPLAERYYAQLVTVDTKDPMVWVARGDNQLAGTDAAGALASYTAAEPLLATDPARRIEVIARRGDALAKLGRDDDAIAEYRRAIAMNPATRRLEAELVTKIIDGYRHKQALPELIAIYEKQWPTAGRRLFEWTTLGELYEEVGRNDQAITAFATAAAIAPAEPAAHRRLIATLERAGRTSDAIAHYELAAKLLPREPGFALTLAERLWPTAPDKALATVAALAARMADANEVLEAIAALYVKWERRLLAAEIYETLAKAEPDTLLAAAEQYVVLGDAARVADVSERIAKLRHPGLSVKLCGLLLDYEMWDEAKARYTEALAADPTNAELYIGRAIVEEHLEHWKAAAADADRAVALQPPGRPSQLAELHPLVKPVIRSRARQRDPQTWRSNAMPRSDWDDHFMLANLLVIRLCHRDPGYRDCKPGDPAAVERLVRRIPGDPELVRALARAFHAADDYDQEIETLHDLEKLVPAERPAIARQIDAARFDAGIVKVAIMINDDAIDYTPPTTKTRDAADGDLRIGLRVGLGAGLRGDSEHSVGAGLTAIVGVTDTIALLARADWTQRVGDMTGNDGIALAAGVTRRVVTTERSIIAVGVAARGELRWRNEMTQPRVMAIDALLDITSRRTPFGAGFRLGQELGKDATTTATFEIAVEWR